MKICIILVLAVFTCNFGQAQYSFHATIKDKNSQQPLIGVAAYLPSLKKGEITDNQGKLLISDIPIGTYRLEIRYIGYETLRLHLTFPLPDSLNGQTFYLSPTSEEMEEVIISSTRSSRTIEDIPTRIEFIAGEELEEKGNMKPGDIRMLLNESTGIQTQQTSATSYNSSIRIQGLDGKYTQLLRDGLPLYSGFSGGLSLMQITPLDLKQVEVIKGASSTLYGGGAIAGLVNLISKTPRDKQELSFMVNGTSALGVDASGFFSRKFDKLGTTIFASYNKGTPYDPANIGLTAIPKFDRFTFNPRMFFYFNNRTEISIGANVIAENRLGGNMDYVEGKQSFSNAYFEENETARTSTQLGFIHQLTDSSKIEVKNSISHYDRSIRIPGFIFSGTQLSSFSEVNYSHFSNVSEWITGLNLWTESFKQSNGSPNQTLDFSNATIGGFIQNIWNVSESWSFESGFRADYQSKYGFFALPKLSVMFKPDQALTFRLGGGMGYKTPTIFSEEAERLQFRNVLPIDVANIEAEQSLGANLDANYILAITDELVLTTNTLLFYTKISDPLVLIQNNGSFEFQQTYGYVDTKGVEMNLKLGYRDFKLFVGYTYSDVNQYHNGSTTEFPLVAKHRLNNVLMYEKEENFWIGLEAYYFSPQLLGDGAIGESYWIVGLMTEKRLGEFVSLFLNFENFLDTRQTAFDTIFTGSIDNPNFRDIYAPVDGFVINGGVKIKL